MKPFWKTEKFQIRLNEPLGEKECPYAYRWVFIFFGYSIRVHKWLRSDDKRYMHNHAWWFLTFVLKGSYTDVSFDSDYKMKVESCINDSIAHDQCIFKDVVKRFSFRFRPSMHTHYVEIPEGGAWTILLTGKPLRKWGFLVNGRFKRPLKFFHKFGHPPCSEQ